MWKILPIKVKRVCVCLFMSCQATFGFISKSVSANVSPNNSAQLMSNQQRFISHKWYAMGWIGIRNNKLSTFFSPLLCIRTWLLRGKKRSVLTYRAIPHLTIAAWLWSNALDPRLSFKSDFWSLQPGTAAQDTCPQKNPNNEFWIMIKICHDNHMTFALLWQTRYLSF